MVVPRRSRGLDPIRLRVLVEYVVDEATERAGWWDARIVGWVYEVRDNADRSMLDFHWHLSSGRVTWLHLHAFGAHESVELHKLHPPTGLVPVSSIVRFLIEDLDVLPRRPDWQTVLNRYAAV